MKTFDKIMCVTAVAVLLAMVPAVTSDAQSYLKAGEKNMQWWRDAKFGLFVHWGPVSLKGTEIGWSRGGERRGREGTGTIPVEVYDNLYREFDPTRFNADEWVEIAKAAGMRYLVFTSKHHDGFSMFDSEATGYKITSPDSPFGRDVVGELAEACHKGGLRLGYYYSPVDWYHPDYRTERHDNYIRFMHQQVRELCSNYGGIDIMWFDGLQIHPMSGSGGEAYYDPSWVKDWDSKRLFRMMRSLQPRLIVNNRCGLEGDFDTPEQHVGFFQTSRAWESCITICRQWAWKPNDRMKSLEECIRILVQTVGGDGNLLLNVGPMPSGEIEPRQVERLREIGAWLKVNGESIYGTRGGPVSPQSWGVTTSKKRTMYVHVLDVTAATVALPKMSGKITGAALMDGTAVEYRATSLGTLLHLPSPGEERIDRIVVLTFDRKPSM